MKMRQLSLAALTALAFAAPAVAAESPFYFQAKAGLMDPKAGAHKNAFNIGGALGFRVFDDQRGSGALEGEVTTTLRDGDKDAGGDWDVNTVAVYFAYRSVGDVYFKGKAGFADQDIGGTGGIPDGSTFSAGIGAGWRVTRKAGVELEYTVLDDLKFISLGVFSHF